jgi:hypothetical protein
MITLQKECLIDCKADTLYLLTEHYNELTLNKEVITLNPDWDRYFELESKNKFHCFTARNDGELVGYSAFFVDTHIHYRDLLVATNDVLFLREDLRLGTTGIKLLKFSEQQLRLLNVNKITWHVKFAKDFRPILHRMGYTDEDTIVGKIL